MTESFFMALARGVAESFKMQGEIDGRADCILLAASMMRGAEVLLLAERLSEL